MSYRVLVTGAGGFLGAYVVRELLKRGHRIRAVDNLSAPGSRTPTDADVEFIQMDLRDRSRALAMFEDVDVCIAAAARCGGIGFFNRRPAEILDDNLRILSSTFEAARTHRIQRIIYVSSSCVFDRSLNAKAEESSLGQTPPPPPGYPSSKLVGEDYCKTYQEQYGLSYTIVRPFNLYGPGEVPGREPGDSHVIPDLAAKLLARQIPLQIFGGGHQTRSFTHVKDVARGVALALESPRAENQDFNLGHPMEISILDLAEILWRICEIEVPFAVHTVSWFEHDVRQRAVDITKAKGLLGWEPQVELSDGLLEFVDWLRQRVILERPAS
jgi:UDP-glucose 4-epimerase